MTYSKTTPFEVMGWTFFFLNNSAIRYINFSQRKSISINKTNIGGGRGWDFWDTQLTNSQHTCILRHTHHHFSILSALSALYLNIITSTTYLLTPLPFTIHSWHVVGGKNNKFFVLFWFCPFSELPFVVSLKQNLHSISWIYSIFKWQFPIEC